MTGMTSREVEELRRTALSFIKSAYLESGEIKVNGENLEDWEMPMSHVSSLPEVLDDLELKTNIALRNVDNRGWVVRRLIVKNETVIPSDLAVLQPFHIHRIKDGIAVYWLLSMGLKRVR